MVERKINTTEESSFNEEFIGGFNLDFTDSIPDRLICLICAKVLRDPHLMICCGKKICISCLNESFKLSYPKSCPHCRREKDDGGPLHVLEKELKSEIESCIVRCTNSSLGCMWQGEIRNMDKHLKVKFGCGFLKLECPNRCTSETGEVKLVYRQNLQEHVECQCELRLVGCHYCDHEGTAKSSKDHELLCKMFPVECPNKCGDDKLPRHAVRKHRYSCPEEPMNCPNNCDTSGIVRRTLDTHRQSCKLEPVPCPNNCGQNGIIRQNLDIHRLTCHHEPVDCPNSCGKSGLTRQSMESHRCVCPYELVECKNAGLGCSENVRCQDVEHHAMNTCEFRTVRCHYCTFEGTATSLVEHLRKCDLFPVECQNDGCDNKRVVRELLDIHRFECQFELIDCKFAHVGCPVRVERKYMQHHIQEKQAEHLELMSEAFKNVNQELIEEAEARESEVRRNKLKAQKYRQQLIDKDIQLQMAQAELKDLNDKFDALNKKLETQLSARYMATQAYDQIKRAMNHKEKVIQKEIELFQTNYTENSLQYSYIVNSKTQHHHPSASSSTCESQLYCQVEESGKDCKSLRCISYRRTCSQSFKSIAAQIHEPHKLSQDRLLLRMVEFGKFSTNSMTWKSPSFALNNKLLMHLNVRFENQSFMKVKINIQEAHESCDRTCLMGTKIKIELIPAAEFMAPQAPGVSEIQDDNRVVKEVDAADLFDAKELILKGIKYSVQGWGSHFVMRDSILWAVTTDCDTY